MLFTLGTFLVASTEFPQRFFLWPAVAFGALCLGNLYLVEDWEHNREKAQAWLRMALLGAVCIVIQSRLTRVSMVHRRRYQRGATRGAGALGQACAKGRPLSAGGCSPIKSSAVPMNIGRLAPFYRWIEYAAFGRALERRRFALLPLAQRCETGPDPGRRRRTSALRNCSLRSLPMLASMSWTRARK